MKNEYNIELDFDNYVSYERYKKGINFDKNMHYVHLNEYELKNFISDYKFKNITIMNYREFKIKYNDLKDFESKLKAEVLTEQFINKYSFYILMLAYFKRISIPESLIFKLKIRWKDLIEIDEELIFIKSKFDDVLGKRFGYSKDWIKEVFREVTRMKLFYQESISVCSDYIDKYLELVPNYRYRCLVKAMFRFLKEIEYIKVDDKYFLRGDKIRLNSRNTSIEFNNVVNDYLINMKNTKALKTFRSAKSNLNNFFNFLEEKAPNIKKFSELHNKHIKEYVKYLQETKTYRNKYISPSTINARLEELQKLIRYAEVNFENIQPLNIISRYDKVKEYQKFPKSVSKSDMLKLIKAIGEIDEKKYLQEKLILILMIDTGRRFHEVRLLSYSCLEKHNHVFFHKTKTGEPIKQKVGPTCINAVLNAQKLCNHIEKEIYSKIDNKKIRRLFPSIKDRCKSIVGEKAVADVFREIQLKNELVDHNDKPLFTLHDNKRNFISNMESAGISALQIAKLINQSIKTIARYEVRNEKATKVLKCLEEKKILSGKQDKISNEIEKESIFNILSHQQILDRNKINLIEKIQNPKEIIPLPIGECSQIENTLFCGELFCMICENYKLLNDSDKKEFEQFCEKFYMHTYVYKKDNRIKNLHKQFENICQNVLVNNKIVDEKNYKKYINGIKKKVRRISSGKL